MTQQEHKVDAKDLVLEFESQGEFLPKVHQASSAHPAAPLARRMMAGRSRVSTS